MQTHILLSIKPEFVEKIFAGLKRYEFRRVIFKSPNVSKVVVYASSPVQRVVGEFEVGGILALRRRQLWEYTKEYSGIAKSYFDEYFADREMAYAIKIKRATRYTRPMALEYLCPSIRPPQSFMYLPAINVQPPMRRCQKQP
jgi:predicted transcriptional regulator